MSDDKGWDKVPTNDDQVEASDEPTGEVSERPSFTAPEDSLTKTAAADIAPLDETALSSPVSPVTTKQSQQGDSTKTVPRQTMTVTTRVPTAYPKPAPAAVPAPEVTQPADPPQVRRTRQARLRLVKFDPWSVMKTAFLFSIAAGVMMFVSVYVVWGVVEASGLFDSLNKVLNEVLGSPDSSKAFQLQNYLNGPRVLGATALLSALNIVIITALTTLFAFLYNLAATVLGGLEVTLAED